MEEDLKDMSKEELLEYLEEISQQLDNIALDQIEIAIAELQYFKDQYKQLEEENRIYVLEGSKARLEMHIKKNYIPVSLVKEKIDDLEKRGYFGEADAMKELLERSREE